MIIPFSKVSTGGNEKKYLNEVLKSGWYTTSSKALNFEKKFAAFVGAEYACALNSCTAALHLSIEAIGIKKGDKVFVPSLTFASSAEVLRYLEADPIFLDVEYGTGLITPEILKRSIERYKKVKAIVLVHYGGQAAQLMMQNNAGILNVCRENGIKIIEDAAHAFPTRHNGKFIGVFGDATCFSFYANKTITTGEGGMITTNDKAIYEKVKLMRLHGIDRDVWHRYKDNDATWEYDIIAPGYKYNMPDVNAAIGLAQLEKAEEFRKQRQRCAEYYYNKLADLEFIDLPICNCPLDDHSWHLFPIVIRPGAPVSRNKFIIKMKDSGVGLSVHYKPLHRMSYYRDRYRLIPESYPNTELMWNGLVSLPIYPRLMDEELEYICKTIRGIFFHS